MLFDVVHVIAVRLHEIRSFLDECWEIIVEVSN